jgi:hypothetical protein
MTHNNTIAAIPNFRHISAPMTLGEIVAEYNGHEYNTEMLLQHLLLWVKRNHKAEVEEPAEKTEEKPAPAYPRPSAYSVTFAGKKLDPYRIADLYSLPAPLAAALKKILRRGRSSKTEAQDLREAIASIERQLEMMEEDKQ